MLSFLPTLNVLIAGGLGFIGSNLARRLVGEGHNIVLVDNLNPQYGGNLANIADIRNRVTINISDIRDPFATNELLKNIDLIFSLAGQTSHVESMKDPFTDLDINAKSQLSLLESVRMVCPEAIVVHASTRQIYGRPKYLPVDEAHPIRPIDVNGVSKAAGEQFHMLYHDVYGVRTTTLRLTNTYGPGMRIKDNRQGFLGGWIRNLLTGNPIKVFGDGKQLRDFNYIDDVVDALVRAARSPASYGKLFNLGHDEVVDLANLADQMVAAKPGASWQTVPFPPERKSIDIGSYYGNYSLAYKLLGWQPQVLLASGLERTLEYYRANLHSYL